MELNNHLVFAGTCEAAFTMYKEIFKGEIVFIFRKGEDKTMQVAEQEKDKISHIVLNTSGFDLWGEDAEAGAAVTVNSSKLVLVFREIEELEKVFAALSDGGTVVTPLHKEFFTECTGEVIDKYGIRWLIMMTDEDYDG